MVIKKDITFIYSDVTEYQLMEPIAKEAQSKGYVTRFTDDPFTKCEIGFYCQHSNLPQNAKFSVITLHDIGQSHGEWPNIWFKEPWNIYDVGFLPSNEWAQRWHDCSEYKEANPSLGVYNIGWTKTDCIFNEDFEIKKKELLSQLNLNPDYKTVLYAPSWENDNKQDDFVSSLKDEKLNLIIKQAPYDKKLYANILKNIAEMNKLHENIENVHILDQSMNIFAAIAISDVMVSDESSTMFEAMLLGIPAVAVEDWLIPDTTPSRHAIVPYEFVYKTTRLQLRDQVMEILSDLEKKCKDVLVFRDEAFNCVGHSSKVVVDMLESVLYNIGDASKYKIDTLPKIETPKDIEMQIAIKLKRTPAVMKIKRSNIFVRVAYKVYGFIKTKLLKRGNS